VAAQPTLRDGRAPRAVRPSRWIATAKARSCLTDAAPGVNADREADRVEAGGNEPQQRTRRRGHEVTEKQAEFSAWSRAGAEDPYPKRPARTPQSPKISGRVPIRFWPDVAASGTFASSRPWAPVQLRPLAHEAWEPESPVTTVAIVFMGAPLW